MNSLRSEFTEYPRLSRPRLPLPSRFTAPANNAVFGFVSGSPSIFPASFSTGRVAFLLVQSRNEAANPMQLISEKCTGKQRRRNAFLTAN
ncbi:hypothetical protein SDJN03_15660, partial [Cucurbita argyrosperma subsp. sororia]